MAGALHDNHDVPMAEINVTPLVDVMLVLLVIFIILAPLFAQALRVELPAADAPPLDEPVLIDVVVNAEGQITVADEPMRDIEEVSIAVSDALRTEPEAVIRIGGDDATNYGLMAKVIGAIQAGGGEKLAFATQQPGKE